MDKYVVRIVKQMPVRDLRRQFANFSTATSATTQHPKPMDSSSEDSESDSSSSSSASSSSSESSLSEYSAPGEPKVENEMLVDASLSAEEEEDLANGVSKCNGYHSARSNTPPSSPSRSTSPVSAQQSPRQPDASTPSIPGTEDRRSM